VKEIASGYLIQSPAKTHIIIITIIPNNANILNSPDKSLLQGIIFSSKISANLQFFTYYPASLSAKSNAVG
jgi:hypothetical protein